MKKLFSLILLSTSFSTLASPVTCASNVKSVAYSLFEQFDRRQPEVYVGRDETQEYRYIARLRTDKVEVQYGINTDTMKADCTTTDIKLLYLNRRNSLI